MLDDVALLRVILEGRFLVAPGAKYVAVQHPNVIMAERLTTEFAPGVPVNGPAAL
jgi:hypothetical protein